MKYYDWMIIVALIIVISSLVNVIQTPYIGEIQFSRNDLSCSGCIEAHSWSDIGKETGISTSIIIAPDVFYQNYYDLEKGNIKNNTGYHCFSPNHNEQGNTYSSLINECKEEEENERQ
jgi:hypothetical protein